MDYMQAKLQGTLNPVKKLAKCFASLDTLMQFRSRQNRSKYNADGSVQVDHALEALEQRQKDFLEA